MGEAQIFEAAIGHIESGQMYDAARLLRQSTHPRAAENAGQERADVAAGRAGRAPTPPAAW